MTERIRPERTKPIGEKYCERCKKMHKLWPEDFDMMKEEVEQAAWDLMEAIDAEIFQELLDESSG